MADKEMTAGKKLQKEIIFEPQNCGLTLDDAAISAAYDFCEHYKGFLNSCKTERESVDFAVAEAKKRGYSEFVKGKMYKPGDKVYLNNRKKSIILAIIGSEPIENGVNLVASHIDAPRLDFKPRPMYEEAQLTYFKTHYYGGIKKYQWTAIPLAIHGVVALKNGESVNIVIGEDESDPVFCITDLLPHLASEQMKGTLNDGIKGENLNLLSGSLPYKEEGLTEKVKLNIMKILNEKYGIIESDFLSADIEVVPAFPARDIGIDRSMVGAYGHDDRVCAYTSLMAALECNNPKKTMVTVLADREEIGSEGVTGLRSAFLRYFIADLADLQGVKVRDVLSASRCLSADVTIAFDPHYAEPYEKKNSAYFNYGVSVMKYTGARGKSSTSEATAEFVREISDIFEKNDVSWQMTELGKVDAGGGGTVAMYIAELNVDVIDLGVPVLSMHSPFEVVSKIDTYMTYRAFSAFLND